MVRGNRLLETKGYGIRNFGSRRALGVRNGGGTMDEQYFVNENDGSISLYVGPGQVRSLDESEVADLLNKLTKELSEEVASTAAAHDAIDELKDKLGLLCGARR